LATESITPRQRGRRSQKAFGDAGNPSLLVDGLRCWPSKMSPHFVQGDDVQIWKVREEIDLGVLH